VDVIKRNSQKALLCVEYTAEKLRNAKSMLKDIDNYPFVSDIIKTLGVGRTTFYRQYPPEKIDEIRNL